MKPESSITTTAGIKIPKIIYGTAWKKERTAELVEQAIVAGFRGIDTACQPKHYHEAGVGEGIAACINRGLVTRPGLYLQTKFTSLDGQDPQRIPYDPKASLSDQVTQSFQVSLANLQTIYLDCLVLHSPMTSPQLTLEVWRAMEKLVKSGGIKQLGISNCYELEALEALYLSAEIKPAIIQNRFYANTDYDRAIRAFCKVNGIIYQSFWTLTANPHVLADYSVLNIASKYQHTPAQVFFRYLSQIGIVPLTGTTSSIHMQEDLSIFEFELNYEDCAAIESLL
ncbi:aldo/keto reductase [Methyloglobulus sp.]|uniref:aldo/keto reductase family protein n=1 Tax=Methyloglobulus sp. TaxID=2518622 RepID=UPI0032B763C7